MDLGVPAATDSHCYGHRHVYGYGICRNEEASADLMVLLITLQGFATTEAHTLNINENL